MAACPECGGNNPKPGCLCGGTGKISDQEAHSNCPPGTCDICNK